MARVSLILLSLLGVFTVTTATPVDLFGARRLQAVWNSQFGAEDNPLDRASKAKNIHDVLRILFPDREPEDVWQDLTVEKDVANSIGRLGPSIVTRPATSQDLVEIQVQVDKSQCAEPVEVTVDAYSELGYERRLGTLLWPECVTVPRCDVSCGCCGEGEICTSISGNQTQTPKLFYVFSEEGSHVAIKNITTHTSCECQADPESGRTLETLTSCPPPAGGCPPPKVWDEESCTCTCTRTCPEPYLQDPHTCECDCLHSNKECGKIKRGQKHLPAEGCMCARNGGCELPACKYGIFDTSICRCPA